jgi:hypothetical protein
MFKLVVVGTVAALAAA